MTHGKCKGEKQSEVKEIKHGREEKDIKNIKSPHGYLLRKSQSI